MERANYAVDSPLERLTLDEAVSRVNFEGPIMDEMLAVQQVSAGHKVDKFFFCRECNLIAQDPLKCNMMGCEAVYCSACLAKRRAVGQANCRKCGQPTEFEELSKFERLSLYEIQFVCYKCNRNFRYDQKEKHQVSCRAFEKRECPGRCGQNQFETEEKLRKHLDGNCVNVIYTCKKCDVFKPKLLIRDATEHSCANEVIVEQASIIVQLQDRLAKSAELVDEQKDEIVILDQQITNLRLLYDQLESQHRKMVMDLKGEGPNGEHQKQKLGVNGEMEIPDADNPNVYLVESPKTVVFKARKEVSRRKNMGYIPSRKVLENIGKFQLRTKMLKAVYYTPGNGLYSVSFSFPNNVMSPDTGYRDPPKEYIELNKNDEPGTITFGTYKWPDGGEELMTIEGYSKETSHRLFKAAGKYPVMEKKQLKLNHNDYIVGARVETEGNCTVSFQFLIAKY